MSIANIFGFLFFSQLLVFGTLDRLQKALEKNEFLKAEELILKGYEKEPSNPGISFYHAQMLFTTTYDKYNPDSARTIINRSLQLYQSGRQELIAEIAEDGITLEKIHALSEKIRNHHFQETINQLSLNSIETFRTNYPESSFETILIFKRDSIVFEQVKKDNSETEFSRFIAAYPTSVFKPEADSLRDGLRYNKLKTTGSLKDYYAFLAKYPFTRWEFEVENYILELSTVSHSSEAYLKFIRTASSKKLQKKAADVLYYVDSDKSILYHPDVDSIKNVSSFARDLLFPIMDRNLFGFYSMQNRLQVPYAYEDVSQETKCHATEDDWVFVFDNDSGSIINKGNQLVVDNVEDYVSLGNGVALLTKGDEKFIYHKSGFRIISGPVENAEVLNGQWIKIKQNNKWGLFSFLGVPIAESKYDDIYVLGDFWVFEKNGLLAAYTEDLILQEIEDRGLSLEFKFEDIELVDSTMLIGFRGERECLLNNQMNFLVPWGPYEIHPDPSGWYLRSEDGYRLYNNVDDRVMDRTYPYLEANEGWLALQTETDWILIPRTKEQMPSRSYDSLKVINRHAVLTLKDDQKTIIFSNGKKLDLEDHAIRTVGAQSKYLLISNDGSTGIYDENGAILIDGKFTNVSFLNDTLVRVSEQGKQGIVTTKGNYLLQPNYESIDEKDGLVLTLQNGKIGCYDLTSQALISPIYESRISSLGDNYLVKKEGKYGMIAKNEDEVVGFNYDQIALWNDTSYLVSTDGKSLIIDQNEEVLVGPIQNLESLFTSPQQTIYRYVQNGRFGLISNQLGLILDAEFTDIFNIGSKNIPLFFADQNLAKAGFHVVSYINEMGELIFSKAYRKQEFERILCDD